MKTNSTLRGAVRLALASSAAATAMYGVTATAQDTAPQKEEADVGTIVVTGSRIRQPNVEGSSPVSVIGSSDIYLQGVTQVEDLINNLPQAFADQGGNISNGATGTATVNLRNLGSPRTLVLVNGRPLPPGSPLDGATDLNQIPAPLIDRVEVLTGGASAVYGSDAVAGVVNFIMRDNFEGVQFDINYNFNNHSNSNSVGDTVSGAGYPVPESSIDADGESYDASLLLGSNFADDRGNATIYLGYREVKALLQSERDYSACALASSSAGFSCGGSSTSFPGRFFSNNADGQDIYGIPNDPLDPCGQSNPCFPNAPPRPNAAGQDVIANSGFTIADANGNTRPFAATDLYNYGPLNYYQRPDERYSFAAFAHYDVNDYATVYTELMIHDDRTRSQIAPSGLFGLIADIDCTNPLLSASNANQLCNFPTTYVPDMLPDDGDPATDDIDYNGVGQHVPSVAGTASTFILRRNVEGGGRIDDLRHSSYRAVVGFRGTVAENWDYDVSGQYGTVIYQESYLNDFSITRAARAMDVVDQGLATGGPANGVAVCQSVIDGSDPGCVPYNIWALGGPSPEALAYLQTPGFQRGDTSLTVISATMAADLGAYGIKIPFANEGIGLAFGVSYSDYGLTNETDQAFTTGDLFGQGGPTIGLSGSYGSNDLFAEVRVPIAQEKFLANALTLNASYRYSDYDTGIQTDTYGAGLEWAPIQDVKFRGSYQRAVRVANVIELFQAQGNGLFDSDNDPCGPAMQNTVAECQRTGLSPAQYGDPFLDSPAGQYNQLLGGNPALTPETADSVTVGIVLTPSFLDGFSLTVDYFNIKVEDVIDTLPPTVTLTQCLETGDPLFCNLITRDQFGSLWALPAGRIVATNLNLATWETSGFDIAMRYRTEIGSMGSLDFDLLGTLLDEFVQEPVPGLGSYDCAGLYGSGTCGTPLPEWRHKARVTWMTPWSLDLSLTWRYFDAVLFEQTSSNPLLTGPVNEVDRELEAQNYLDLAGSWTFKESYTARLGLNNVLDDDPPVSAQVGAGFGNGNTFPQVYDAFGRYIYMSLTAKF